MTDHDEIVKLIEQRLELRRRLSEVEGSLKKAGIEDLDFKQRVADLQKLILYYEKNGVRASTDEVEIVLSTPRFIAMLREELEDAQRFLAAKEKRGT